MKKILFLSNGKAYLPEIEAYKKFFSEYICIDSRNEKNINLYEYELIWKFMGIDLGKIDRPVIHEYASASVGIFPKVKNTIKSLLNSKPSARIFLNEEVRKQFVFNDRVPCYYRDMGIDCSFFINNSNKKYDFLYIGDISRGRNVDVLLRKFVFHFPENTILLIGKYEKDLYLKYRSYKNIHFSGYIPYQKVPLLASECKYGINYIPDIYPYNIQTSTKLLEYLALGLKVITTDYCWINKFENEQGMRFFKISEDFSNFNINNISQFQFVNKDISKLKWHKILEVSGLKEYIEKII